MGTGYKAADEFLAGFKEWKAKKDAGMAERNEHPDGRIRQLEHAIADVLELIRDEHTQLQLVSARTEEQYNLLAGRLDAAAEAVAKIQKRLAKLEGTVR